jgi:hypothetical protein
MFELYTIFRKSGCKVYTMQPAPAARSVTGIDTPAHPVGNTLSRENIPAFLPTTATNVLYTRGGSMLLT